MCAGQMLRLEGVAVAEPPAKFAWFLPNGEPLLHNGDRINIDTSEKNKSTLILKNVDRAQVTSQLNLVNQPDYLHSVVQP